MIKILDPNVTPFGGIHLLHKKIISENTLQFIDNELGQRVKTIGFSCSGIILSRIYTAFCGGGATEDANYIKENTLSPLKGVSIPSADTILRGDVGLSVPCGYTITDAGKEDKVNTNPKMDGLLLRPAIKSKQLNPGDKKSVYGFGHQFIPAEKFGAQYSYKNKKGYFPAVAAISNIPVYIEGRNGNCNVKTEQLASHKRALAALAKEGANPKYARMGSGPCIKGATGYFHRNNIPFFIRANNPEALLAQAADAENRQPCTINPQDMEVASFSYKSGKYNHRIVAYRVPNKTGQISAFSRDAKKYLFIITNDWGTTERGAIVFYNKRGDSERVFDIQDNDFNWDPMPHSFLGENTVYFIIMAVAHIIYKWLLDIFCDVVQGLAKTARLKKFISRFVDTVAKSTKSGRQQIIHLSTKNEALIKLANST